MATTDGPIRKMLDFIHKRRFENKHGRVVYSKIKGGTFKTKYKDKDRVIKSWEVNPTDKDYDKYWPYNQDAGTKKMQKIRYKKPKEGEVKKSITKSAINWEDRIKMEKVKGKDYK